MLVKGFAGLALVAVTALPLPGPYVATNAAANRSGVPTLRCPHRVEAGAEPVDRRQDTVIGPLVFHRAEEAYRAGLHTPPRRNPYGRYQPVHLVVLVRAGAQALLQVPRSERAVVSLLYVRSNPRGRSETVFDACHHESSPRSALRECGWRPDTACRSRPTEFEGGFEFNYAPSRRAQLRCARVTVRVLPHGPTLTRFLLPREARDCPARP